MKEMALLEAFKECQKGIHSHPKLATALKKTYDQLDTKSPFHQEFIGYFKHALIVFKREPAVERTLDFVAMFAASFAIPDNSDEEEEDEEQEMPPTAANNFLFFLFDFLLNNHKARDRAVRFRVCQMINKLLHSMGSEAQIDETLYQGIYRCMMVRLHDKFPAVRSQAVAAVHRLQDPGDEDCPVITAYLHLIEHDINHEVRRAVLSNISTTALTLPKILGRSRDVKDTIRKTTYQVLAEKVHIKALTIAQRVQLLQDGLTDRSDMVKEACSGKLLQAWLRLVQGNILDLLAYLDVENSCTTAELALEVLFKKVSPHELVNNFDMLDDKNVIPVEQLTWESALYWRCLCSFLKGRGLECGALLEGMLPSVTSFANYTRSFLAELRPCALSETEVEESLKKEFVAQQLLQLCGLQDLSDEVGRKNFDELLNDMLIAPHIPPALVPLLVTHLTTLHPNEEQQVTLAAAAIADVREPISILETSVTGEEKRKKDRKLAGVRVALNEARDALEDCVRSEDFTRAAELKNLVTDLESSKESMLEESTNSSIREIRTEKCDPETLVKCLTIASEMLQRLTTSKGLGPTLQTLINTLVLPGVQNTDLSVRNMAVKCVGLASQLSCDFAHQHLLLLMQICQVDQETIQVSALKSIFDLLHTFGLDAFKLPAGTSTLTSSPPTGDDLRATPEDGEQGGAQQDKNAANSVLAILTGLLDSESSEVCAVVAEGMAKLLLSGRVTSSKLLSRLLLLWYNPTTEEDLYLRHCLGTFFPVFSFASRSNQDCVEEAFLPTLETLFDAPTTSPLAQVNEGNVAELLVHLTDPRNLNQETALQESSVHDSLALKICNKLLSDVEAPGVRVLCRVLNTLHLTPTNTAHLRDLSILADQIIEVAEERFIKKQLDKFRQSLQETLEGSPEETPEGEAPEGEALVGGTTQGSPPLVDGETEKPTVEPEGEAIEDEERVDTQQPGITELDHQQTPPQEEIDNDELAGTTARHHDRLPAADEADKMGNVRTAGVKIPRPSSMLEDTENIPFQSPVAPSSRRPNRSRHAGRMKMTQLLSDDSGSEKDTPPASSTKHGYSRRNRRVLADLNSDESV